MCNIVLVCTKSIRTSLNEKRKKIKLFAPHKERVLSCFIVQMLFKAMNPCYVQLNFFADCIMHVTYTHANILVHSEVYTTAAIQTEFEFVSLFQ